MRHNGFTEAMTFQMNPEGRGGIYPAGRGMRGKEFQTERQEMEKSRAQEEVEGEGEREAH